MLLLLRIKKEPSGVAGFKETVDKYVLVFLWPDAETCDFIKQYHHSTEYYDWTTSIKRK